MLLKFIESVIAGLTATMLHDATKLLIEWIFG